MGLEADEILLKRYQIVRIIGKGGTATVYLCFDLERNIQVAIKELETKYLLDQKSRLRFIVEARIMQQLRHPNIVQFYDVFDPSSAAVKDLYIVMEYMPGGSLESLLIKQPALPIAKAIKIAVDIGKGLHRAHQAGIVHRDVKQSNILLDATGELAKISDFGVAHIPSLGLTSTGQPGTLLYLSPEQAMNKEVDTRSDLYSLGVVLYQLLTGGQHYLDLERCLHKRKNNDPIKAICQAIVHDPPRKPSYFRKEISPALDEIMVKSLAKKPRERYQKASEMVEALESILVEEHESHRTSIVQVQREEFQPAALFTRLFSGIIDFSIAVILSAILSILIAITSELVIGPDYNAMIMIGGILPLLFYFPTFWLWRRQTLGMVIFHIYITNVQGNNPSKRAIIIRYLIYLPYILTLGIPFFLILLDKSRQGVYDTISGIQSIKSHRS